MFFSFQMDDSVFLDYHLQSAFFLANATTFSGIPEAIAGLQSSARVRDYDYYKEWRRPRKEWNPSLYACGPFLQNVMQCSVFVKSG